MPKNYVLVTKQLCDGKDELVRSETVPGLIPVIPTVFVNQSDVENISR